MIGKKEKKVRKEKKNIFMRPSRDEVKAYCRERRNDVDPDRWYDHYEANGWRVGKALAPMIDWKAAVRTWEHNEIHANNTLDPIERHKRNMSND
jgi:hypothetical protein